MSEAEDKDICNLRCNICENGLREPVTLTCGHTTCKRCLTREKQCRCGCGHDINNIRVNVVVRNIINKISDGGVLKRDCTCSICYQVYLHPVTTTCGHTFCRDCLLTAIDYTGYCPICKTIQSKVYSYNTTKFLDKFLPMVLYEDIMDKIVDYEDDMRILQDLEELPVFVCTVAFPNISCPLNIFEPRYRLMLRRCLESGSKKFGMCSSIKGSNKYNGWGTILRITNAQLQPDGTSLIETVGWRRFKIMTAQEKDGYIMATFQYITDKLPNDDKDIKLLHDNVRIAAIKWINAMNAHQKKKIATWFGKLPEVEVDYVTSSDGPVWLWWIIAILPLGVQSKNDLLQCSSLEVRLKTVLHFLLVLKEQGTAANKPTL